MTKREMIEEMIEGLNFHNNEMVIENRCKSTKKRIEEVYHYYQKTSKTINDKYFCINLLVNL